MERGALVAYLADEIVGRKEKTRPLKVAIDGRCASRQRGRRFGPAIRRSFFFAWN